MPLLTVLIRNRDLAISALSGRRERPTITLPMTRPFCATECQLR
jgi:hypothetical protein